MSSLFDPRLVAALRAYKPEVGVMSQQPQEGWKPEYEKEPALEAPMVSPEDIIQGAPKLGALGVKALAGALKSGILAIPGSLKGVGALRDLFVPGGEVRKRIVAGEHPEKVLRDLFKRDQDLGVTPTSDNFALRYETSRPKHDKNVAHYDASGGSQMIDIMKYPPMANTDSGEMSPSSVARYLRNSQIRKADISKIPEDQAVFNPYDDWMMNFEPKNTGGKHEFYSNIAEGNINNTRGLATPKIRDVINDPELRKAWNMSLAVPGDSPFHMTARILRGAE